MLFSIYVHELLHYYGEYVSQTSLLDYFNKNIPQSKIKIESLFHNIFYSLQKLDQNAFIPKLHTVLYKNHADIKTYQDAIKHFGQTNVFKRYFGLYVELNRTF